MVIHNKHEQRVQRWYLKAGRRGDNLWDHVAVEVEWRLKEMHATNSYKNIMDESL